VSGLIAKIHARNLAFHRSFLSIEINKKGGHHVQKRVILTKDDPKAGGHHHLISID
jgi:hypothetical protein